MPSYRVIGEGFFGGVSYSPKGKRTILHVDAPFNKKNPPPAWIDHKPMVTSVAKSAKSAARVKADKNAKEVDESKKAISFIDQPVTNVETL